MRTEVEAGLEEGECKGGEKGSQAKTSQVRWGQIGVGQPDPGAGLEGRLGLGLEGFQSL